MSKCTQTQQDRFIWRDSHIWRKPQSQTFVHGTTWHMQINSYTLPAPKMGLTCPDSGTLREHAPHIISLTANIIYLTPKQIHASQVMPICACTQQLTQGITMPAVFLFGLRRGVIAVSSTVRAGRGRAAPDKLCGRGWLMAACERVELPGCASYAGPAQSDGQALSECSPGRVRRTQADLHAPDLHNTAGAPTTTQGIQAMSQTRHATTGRVVVCESSPDPNRSGLAQARRQPPRGAQRKTSACRHGAAKAHRGTRPRRARSSAGAGRSTSPRPPGTRAAHPEHPGCSRRWTTGSARSAR